MAMVKIPTQLRQLTDGAAEVDARGGTVGELIGDLESRHPGIKDRLLDDSGKLRRFVNVYVNDEDVRFEKGLDTEIPDGGRVSIIPAVAGGV
jgi:sulfur-carrier protein